MMSYTVYLDCGCAIIDGSRKLCPSCADTSPRPDSDTAKLRAQLAGITAERDLARKESAALAQGLERANSRAESKHRSWMSELDHLRVAERDRDALRTQNAALAQERDEAQRHLATWRHMLEVAQADGYESIGAVMVANDTLRKELSLTQSSLRDREHQWLFGVEVQSWFLKEPNDWAQGETMLDTIQRWKRDRDTLRTQNAALAQRCDRLTAAGAELVAALEGRVHSRRAVEALLVLRAALAPDAGTSSEGGKLP